MYLCNIRLARRNAVLHLRCRKRLGIQRLKSDGAVQAVEAWNPGELWKLLEAEFYRISTTNVNIVLTIVDCCIWTLNVNVFNCYMNVAVSVTIESYLIYLHAITMRCYVWVQNVTVDDKNVFRATRTPPFHLGAGNLAPMQALNGTISEMEGKREKYGKAHEQLPLTLQNLQMSTKACNVPEGLRWSVIGLWPNL